MDKRLGIQRLHFVFASLLYMVAYLYLKPADTHIASVVFTVLASPLLIFPYYIRTSSFFFVRNWYYGIYLFVSTLVFIFVMSFFVQKWYNDRFLIYEFQHIVLATTMGYCSALVVSLPFKLTQMIIFGTDMYISIEMMEKLDYEAFPEKRKEKIDIKSDTFKYEMMNETQLEVELKNAIREDRFEDAEKIKKVLDKKFNYGK